MVEPTCLSGIQVKNYLERLGFDKSQQEIVADKKTLDELTFLHQCSIPFETIDMHHCDYPPNLDPDVVFEKLVTKQRGGYCFELNALYELLLVSLGYKARPLLCRAVNGQNGITYLDHRGILVELPEASYFVDVGFGGPLAAGALALERDKEQVVRGEYFAMKQLDECWWAVKRKSQGKKDLYEDDDSSSWQIEVELCLASMKSIDFIPLNAYCSRPGSLFRETYIANRRTANGYHGITNNKLTIRKNGVKKVTELTDEAAFADALETYFGFRP